jgi:polysaccharide pyruvyl transferase WcaK-like protein
MLTARVIGKRAPKLWQFEWRRQLEMARQSPFSPTTAQPARELFRRISNASLIVTGRFHMVCLAMLARTPFIALPGNTYKIEGMLTDAGLANRFRSSLCDMDDLRSWSRWQNDETMRIETYLQNARSRISGMFSRIGQSATDW